MNDTRPRHLVRLSDLPVEEVGEILATARREEELFRDHWDTLRSAIVGMLFVDESLRTRSSFRSAILRLGGNTLDFPGFASARADGGRSESVHDFIKTVEFYCNALVVRTRDSALLDEIVQHASIPILSAGHGNVEHPTTGLGQRLALERELSGGLEGATILLIGRFPKRGIHSFLAALRGLKGIRILSLAPASSRLPDACESMMREWGIDYVRLTTYAELLPYVAEVSVLYVDDHPRDGLDQASIPGLDMQDLYFNRLSRETVLTAGFPRTALTPEAWDPQLRSICISKSKHALFGRAAALLWILRQSM